MRLLYHLIWILTLLFYFCGADVRAMALALQDTVAKPDSAKADSAGAAAQKNGARAQQARPGGKTFDETVKDFRKVEGLFTFYIDDEEKKVFLEILPEQMGKTYLLSVSRTAGDGFFFDSGALLGRLPVMFRQVGKLVQLLHRNVYFSADGNAPMQRALEKGVTHSVLENARMLSDPHPERKSVLIDAAEFFLVDIDQVSSMLGSAAKVPVGFDKMNSYFESVKSFPDNSEFETALHFRNAKGGRDLYRPGGMIPDMGSFYHKYHYSLSTLPDTDYEPRVADDRIGHFTNLLQDYSDLLSEDTYVRYVERWNIQKKYPYQEKSPAEAPLVFWLANTIPVEYRQAVAEGILFWNQCFERIGIEGAIVVRQQPDDADWDPADIRYNTVQWIISPGGGYAVGPSRTNPLTGEIYDADIRISADLLRYIFMEKVEYVQPVSLAGNEPDEDLAGRLLLGPAYPGMDIIPKGEIPEGGKDYSRRSCSYADGFARQAALGYSSLLAKGLSKDDPEVRKYIRDCLVHFVAHEVGHTLGMRHNFKASSVLPAEKLNDAEFTTANGMTGSVMDYIPVNIAPEGIPQGQYWQTTPGPWDYWTIEYMYKPLHGTEQEIGEALQAIAARVAEPGLAYGTDEDAMGFSVIGIDPLTNPYDIGSDPMTYYGDRLKLVNELWGKMESQFEVPGNRYPKLLRVFQQGLTEFNLAGVTVTKYIGGIYFYRDHIGDPNGRVPFVPVSAEKQREALNFVIKNILSPEAFNFSPELLNKLAPDRQWTFYSGYGGMIDIPYHQIILAIQRFPLLRMYHSAVLQRILDNELRVPKGATPFTLSEMFTGLREAIWQELKGNKPVNSFRRNLQRVHAAMLINMVLGRVPAPHDAAALARADLRVIHEEIEDNLAAEVRDDMTRVHLEEMADRITAAFDAKPGMNMW